MIWNAVMSAVEWNKKEELVYEQVCRIDLVLRGIAILLLLDQ